MSAPELRHYLNLMVRRYNYVCSRNRIYKLFINDVEHFKLLLFGDKVKLGTLFSYAHIWKLFFIENYFNFFELSIYLKRFNLLKVKVLQNQVNYATSRIH